MVTPLWRYHRTKQQRLSCSSTTTRVQQIVSVAKSSLYQIILVLPPFQSSSPRKAGLTSPLDRHNLLMTLNPSGKEPAARGLARAASAPRSIR